MLKVYGFDTLEEVFLKLCMKDGIGKTTNAMLDATSFNETSYTPSRKHHRDGGHDNMAFNYSISQFDVSQVGVERQDHIKNHPRSLAYYNAVSSIFTRSCIVRLKYLIDLSLFIRIIA